MLENIKISIIVCAYNTEKYIQKCLESILKQSHSNIELIIVDDCSKDDTLKIILDIAKTDNRITVIQNETNKGLSYSRNIALEKATGSYIGYIDSDDYIDEDYYEVMLDKMMSDKSDICVCDMELLYEDEKNSLVVKCGGKEKIDFINNGMAASSCNKLFSKKVISQYKFSEGKVNEDLAVVLPTLILSQKISYEPSVVYHYVQRKNSIQNSKITMKKFDIFYGVDLTLERIKDYSDYEIYKDAIVYQQLITLFLYVFCSEKNFLKRCKWFSIYAKKIKKYGILKNQFYKEFIENVGKKHQIYYKVLLKLIDLRLSFLASILVSFYDILKVLFTRNVISKDIDINKLKKLAKKQKKLKNDISLSVVIPNYNYEKFLLQRLYSILNQNIKLEEIIILDDCSKDNSRELIEEICKELKEDVPIYFIFNDKNSGSAFKQWEKGFQVAKGEYVWICEADDYCDKHFLKKVLNPIYQDKDIVISYSDTAFIDKDGNIILKSIKKEIDLLKSGHWDSDYVNDGVDEIKNYAYLNCTIANVSSAIIKNGDYKEIFKEVGKLKQAGDWLFYLSVMSRGKIAFSNAPLNYYRLHGNNVTSVTKKQNHFNEIKKVHSGIEKQYGLTKKQKDNIEGRYQFLEQVWYIER